MAAAKLVVREAPAAQEAEGQHAAAHATPPLPAPTPGSGGGYRVVGPIADPGCADARAFIGAAAASSGCTVAGVDTEIMPTRSGRGQLCLVQVGDPRHGRLE